MGAAHHSNRHSLYTQQNVTKCVDTFHDIVQTNTFEVKRTHIHAITSDVMSTVVRESDQEKHTHPNDHIECDVHCFAGKRQFVRNEGEE
jgi:hypothetical protein